MDKKEMIGFQDFFKGRISVNILDIKSVRVVEEFNYGEPNGYAVCVLTLTSGKVLKMNTTTRSCEDLIEYLMLNKQFEYSTKDGVRIEK